MNRKQMEAWIENTVANTATPKEAAKKIADRWEDDRELVREYSIADGRDSCTHGEVA